jgi:hypothetical protein
MSTKSKPRGGARPGAGRPAEYGARKTTHCICLTPELWQLVGAMAGAQHASRSQWIEETLRQVVGLPEQCWY